MSPKRRSWQHLIGFFRRRRPIKGLSRGVMAMDLTFPNESRSYDVTRDAVRFWGYVSAIECSFFMTADALRGVAPGLGSDNAIFLDAFDTHRELIYKTAATVFARGRRGSYELVPADF